MNNSDVDPLNDRNIYQSDSFAVNLHETAQMLFQGNAHLFNRLKKEIPELYSSDNIQFPQYPLPIEIVNIQGKYFLEFIVERYYPNKKEYELFMKFINFLSCLRASNHIHHPNMPKNIPTEIFRLIKTFFSPKVFKFVAKVSLPNNYPYFEPKIQIFHCARRTRPLVLDENNWYNSIIWSPPCRISQVLLTMEAEMMDEETEELEYSLIKNNNIISKSVISVNKRNTTIKSVMKTIEDRIRRTPSLAVQVTQLQPPISIDNTNLTLLAAGYGQKCQHIVFPVV